MPHPKQGEGDAHRSHRWRRDPVIAVRLRAAARHKAALDTVAYWATGAPSYRWSELATAEYLKNGSPWQLAARGLALMHVAIYDSMVAAWDSKYAYNR